jgi:hypothetical protein
LRRAKAAGRVRPLAAQLEAATNALIAAAAAPPPTARADARGGAAPSPLVDALSNFSGHLLWIASMAQATEKGELIEISEIALAGVRNDPTRVHVLPAVEAAHTALRAAAAGTDIKLVLGRLKSGAEGCLTLATEHLTWVFAGARVYNAIEQCYYEVEEETDEIDDYGVPVVAWTEPEQDDMEVGLAAAAGRRAPRGPLTPPPPPSTLKSMCLYCSLFKATDDSTIPVRAADAGEGEEDEEEEEEEEDASAADETTGEFEGEGPSGAAAMDEYA